MLGASLGPLDFADGLMGSIFHLLDEQVKFSGKTFEEIQIND